MAVHLTVRVAWHDDRWNGTICQNPSGNAFCIALDRIRAERDDVAESKAAGKSWNQLMPAALPPCVDESGGFMSPHPWTKIFEHPYQSGKMTRTTHGHLQPTPIKIPPYSTLVVPFWWMNREHQDVIDAMLPDPLPADEEPPFRSDWVFGRKRQEALARLFFDQLEEGKSLVFFYCKEGNPLGDSIPRLVVGVGTVSKVGKLLLYESSRGVPYPIWDRVVSHSIRADGTEGFLIPYHEYLEPTGSPDEDARRIRLLEEIAVPVIAEQFGSFSYVGELTGADHALGALVRCLEAVRAIRRHGIARGPWEQREDWLNRQIAAVWKDRGAYPGLGPALEALGIRLGTAMVQELLSAGKLHPMEDPWPTVEAIIEGSAKAPKDVYSSSIKAVWATWRTLPPERKALLRLISRFDLTSFQAARWFHPENRSKDVRAAIEDSDIISNPYAISELDIGSRDDPPVSLGTIDRGLLPDDTIASRHPIPPPSAIDSASDPRRIRASFVEILRKASLAGDSLLSAVEVVERLPTLGLLRPCNVSLDWIEANAGFLASQIEILRLPTGSGSEKLTPALQLADLKSREDLLRKVFKSRAEKEIPALKVSWQDFLLKAIRESGGSFDPQDSRHQLALKEQTAALERITRRRLAVLVGRAGTGKTSVLGALLQCELLTRDGVLLLAPTGKARVRLGRATGAEAMTVAQFLHRLGRYDGVRQRPLFSGDKYRKERTVVIDESSMLTMDDLAAVLAALDLAHVQRLILVGDPNQLPPIGAGRPFADLVGFLETASSSKDVEQTKLADAISRLTVEMRATAGAPSDTLRLASWFTRDPQPVDADRVLSDLELGSRFNDLEVVFWTEVDELHQRLLEQFKKHLGVADRADATAFNRALGFSEEGWVPFEAPDGPENFQILSPVRMHPHGVYELNRWIQRTFRSRELKESREPWGLSLGDEEIVIRDKVIQIRNQWRDSWDGDSSSKVYLANGEIGTASHRPRRRDGRPLSTLNVLFAGRPNLTVGYRPSDFAPGEVPLELAYALTVHKAQGSEFRKVFVVLPRHCGILSRELLYTALTRSRDRLVLFVEGSDVSSLYDYSKPESSETARRNTNLFYSAIRERLDVIPYAEYLIHKTERGEMVRSKSELVIANMLFRMGVPYEYERPLDGENIPGRLRPDFSFVDPAGDLLIWEHLGLLVRDDYRKAWNWKRDWYEKNGYSEGKNLFTTADDERGGLDSTVVKAVAEEVRSRL